MFRISVVDIFCGHLRSHITQKVSRRTLRWKSASPMNYGLFINGETRSAENNDIIDIISPATNTAFATLANASSHDVNDAVQSAHACFHDIQGSWRQTTAQQRSKMLHAMADEIANSTSSWAELESNDCGKPITESEADMSFCVDILRFYANIAQKAMAPRELDTGDPEYKAQIVPEPLGVIGCITPWNYPLMQSVNKVAPALAAGCTLVLKPSPLASLTSVKLAELAHSVGVPAGAFNLVTGGPPLADAGGSETLATHPLLDKLSFTGSGTTGKYLLHASADNLRPTSLELGGKGAIVVFDDVDMDAAIDWVMVGIFLCAGQVSNLHNMHGSLILDSAIELCSFCHCSTWSLSIRYLRLR
eukprot:m.933384 g.933384  ORF g.933384 m.933384 type:complete len:361 (+) comp23795_c0_seq46:132-1214(+)